VFYNLAGLLGGATKIVCKAKDDERRAYSDSLMCILCIVSLQWFSIFVNIFINLGKSEFVLIIEKYY
jgi:hypothetical protein